MKSRGVALLSVVAGLLGAPLVAGDAWAAQCGKAAWYDLGGQTASGERSTGSGLTAAHRTLPFGTRVRVDNLDNGRSVVVRVNDRGPFVGGRVIDVTRAAAEELGMVRSGIAKVRVSLVDSDAKLDNTCADPSPRILTAEAVASDAARTKAAAAGGGSKAAPSGRGLVASVQYDEASGTAPARGKAAAGNAATFSDEPQLDDLDTAPARSTASGVPLPRPRPPRFDDSQALTVAAATSPAVFNRTLALRFLDAFAPPEPGMQLDVRALGYAPMPEPRGAIITE